MKHVTGDLLGGIARVRRRAASLLRELAEAPDILRRLADELDAVPGESTPERRLPRLRQRELRVLNTGRVTELDRERAERSLRRAGERTR